MFAIEGERLIAARMCPWFTVALRNDGLLQYLTNPGLVITHEIALQVVEVGLQITDVARPTLVLMTDVARIDRQARAFFVSEEYMRVCCQTALVVGSPVSRVIGSFFVGLNRPTYPVKIFDDEKLAVAWLHGFLSA